MWCDRDLRDPDSSSPHDLTPCARRAAAGEAGKPCQRTFGEQRCTFCGRELPLTHPTFVTEVNAKFRAAGAGLPVDDPIRGRPLIGGLPALCAQLSARHDVGLRVIEQILDDVVPMLDLLTHVRQLVDEAKDGSAMAWLDAFAGIRDVLYPDTDVARRLNERRRMTPEQRAAERERADASEREAWAGISSDIPDGPPTCDECGSALAEVRGRSASGRELRGVICMRCASTAGAGTAHLDDDEGT